MAEIRANPPAKKSFSRRLIQLYAALLYNAHLKGFISGEIYTRPLKAACVPGLNCYSCPGAAGACPLGALQNALAASGHAAGWYVLGILLLFGVTLGRTICGWLCPMGLLQELLHQIPTPKIRKSFATRALSWLKYAVLAVFVIGLPLLYGLAHDLPLPAFCKYICPAGTLEGAGALLAHPANGDLFAQLGLQFTQKNAVLAALILLCVFCYRAFCRFLCPLGAIYGLFNRFALTGMRVSESACVRCGACVKQCPMDIRRVGDHECIACGQCVAACPKGAISLQCGKITLMGPETGPAPAGQVQRKRRVWLVWSALLALLATVLLMVNVWQPDGADAGQPTFSPAAADTRKDSESGETEERAAVLTPEPTDNRGGEKAEILLTEGPDVGQLLPDFTCTLLDGTAFTLSDYRGQVVFINQWATYCTPCVEEMPHFQRLQEEHPDIVVLLFHHWLESNPKAVPFLEGKGWLDAWQVRFALDPKTKPILTAIGGTNTMPRTVVVNKRGEVVYNAERSVTYEMLEALLQQALDSAP